MEAVFDEIGGRLCSRRADVDRRCVLVIVSSHDGERQAHATIEDDYEGVRMPWIHDGAARSDAGGRKVSPWLRAHFLVVLKCRADWLGEGFSKAYFLPEVQYHENELDDFTLV
ncbi:hypothetical protein THAOC_26005, partial [Thalassiosira oceanica]